MKTILNVFSLLLLAVLPLSLVAQNTTVVIEYMKVSQESEDAYLEVEQEWKKVHEKRIEEGLCNGWQLWRNIYAGYGDPYQYMTINWYSNWAHSLAPVPETFWENLDLELDDDFFAKTIASRVLVEKEVSHSSLSAENNQGGKFIRINRMRPAPGSWDANMKLEAEVFKPLFEEAIRKGTRANWGVWESWPYDEGQVRFVTVDGFDNIEQMTSEDLMSLFPMVHPDLEASEVMERLEQLREMAAIEIWELVDAAWPEAAE